MMIVRHYKNRSYLCHSPLGYRLKRHINRLGDHLYGIAGNDTIDGQAGDDYIEGNTGADTIQGGSGADEIHGGTDNDTLDGGADKDTLYGEAGNDRLGGGEGDDILYGDVSGETQSTLNGDILVKTDTCTRTTPMRRTTPYGTLNDQIDGGDDYISNTADIPGGKSRFSQVLWQKYTSSPRGMCVTSYRNRSALIRARSHGAWSGKRAPSQSRMAVATRACAHFHQSKVPA